MPENRREDRRTRSSIGMPFVVLLFITTALLLSACNQGSPRAHTPTLPNAEPRINPVYESLLEEFYIVNTAGNRIYGMLRRPDPEQYPDMAFVAFVYVPGGIQHGRTYVLSPEAIALAKAGMVVVGFNAEGRVDDRSEDDLLSEGEQNDNGARDQDTLADVLISTMQLPYIISDNVGIRSQSYGITMAAGCAFRHPELPIKYIVDGEGPSASFVTVHEPYALNTDADHPHHDKYEEVFGILGHYSLYHDSSEENRAIWEEREAIRDIISFNGMYLRLQADYDHSQPPGQFDDPAAFYDPPIWYQARHTCDMVNVAIAGGVPWVRVNLPPQGNPVNAVFGPENLPVLLPGAWGSDPMVPACAVLEMARADAVRR